MSESDKIRCIFESPVVDKVYDDLVHTSAKETGKHFSRIFRYLNALFLKPDLWALQREKNYELTEALLNNKIKNISDDKLTYADSYISIPALQALSYSIDNEELRNLYANLLARSVNIDEKVHVHPAFVEIIKQMSPIDAIVFKEIMNTAREIPIIHIYKYNSPGTNITGSRPYKKNLNKLMCCGYAQSRVSLDNLQRLMLIVIPDNVPVSDRNDYDPIRQTSLYKNCAEELGNSLDAELTSIEVTELAQSFYDVCVKDPD